MTSHAWILLAVYSAVLMMLAIPMGRFIACVMEERLRFTGHVESLLLQATRHRFLLSSARRRPVAWIRTSVERPHSTKPHGSRVFAVCRGHGPHTDCESHGGPGARLPRRGPCQRAGTEPGAGRRTAPVSFA